MTVRADEGTCTLEELQPVATNAGAVVRIIGDVWIARNLLPVWRWDFMAAIARSFVLAGFMRKF